MRRTFPRTFAAACAASLLAFGAWADNAAPTVDQLIAQLASKDLPVRREAAFQLARLGAAAKPALPALLKALDDEDKQVWSESMEAIAAMGPAAQDAIPVLIDRLGGRKGGGNRRERDLRQGTMRTADTLAHMGPAAVPPLIEALGSNDVTLRVGAARALGGMGAGAIDAAPALIKNLGDKQDSVRDESVQALARLGSKAGPALVTALQDPEPLRRAGAATALAQMEPPYREGAKDVEKAALKESDQVVLAALYSALPKTGMPADHCVAILLPAITNENEALRHAALNALLAAPAQRTAAVPKLGALLKDANPAVRERAARALGRIGPDAAAVLPALLEAARAADGAQAYAEALAQIGPKALPALLAVLQKGKPGENKWVLPTLRAFGPPAVPALAEALKNNSPELRAAAATALGEMGHDAAPATAAIFVLTKDADPVAQAASFRALVAIHADASRLKPLLQEALTSSDAGVRQAAAAGLAAFGGAAALGVDGLVALLSDPNPAGRLAAAQAIGQLGAKAAPAVGALAARLDDADLQSTILETLGQLGPAAAPAVPRLVELAKKSEQRTTLLPVLTKIGPGAAAALPMIYAAAHDPSQDVRASAATALAAVETDNAKALAVLIPLVGDTGSGKVRRMTTHALEKYGPAASDAVPALIKMLDKDTERGEAMRTLKAIGVRKVPDLLTMLAMRDPKVRTFACESLGTLGPAAKDAGPLLHEIAEQDGAVRASATAALKKIEAPAPEQK